MSKKDQFKKMVPDFVGYLNRYASENLHLQPEPIQKKAEEIYQKMYEETPAIGGKDNPMAANLYEFMTFCAYYEASNHQIDEKSVSIICGWMMEKMKPVGKIIDLNKPSLIWLAKKFITIFVDINTKKKADGKWGDTWTLKDNPLKHREGVSIHLYGCPLLAFAKAHGYEKMMPSFCIVDHQSIEMMHGKLLRFSTEATGGSCCDYWIVGDQSEVAKKYAGMPKK